MRDIKFRAWDKSVKTMCGVGEIHFCHGGIKAFGPGVHLGNGWVTEDNEHKHHCDVILMQYTGLQDKNGKDIYEGDIVNRVVYDDGEEYIQEVAWDEDRDFLGWNINPGDQLKVIGNIYESPELLED